MGQSHICTIMSYFPYSNVLTLGDLLTLRRPPPAKLRPMASSSPASALLQYKPLSPEPTPGHLFNWPHTQPLSTSPGYPILSDSPTTQSQLKSFKLAGPTLPTPPHSLPPGEARDRLPPPTPCARPAMAPSSGNCDQLPFPWWSPPNLLVSPNSDLLSTRSILKEYHGNRMAMSLIPIPTRTSGFSCLGGLPPYPGKTYGLPSPAQSSQA